MLKKILNNFWVRFDQPYGFYETVGEKTLYFFDRPIENYVLTNEPFTKEPFYAQFHFEISGQRAERWYFLFSFMAHIGMGHTPFGNGPAANDIGLIDESQADPNAWIHGFGRVDGDRGFVSKLFFGTHLTQRLFLSLNVKYRDGNPYTFFDTHYGHDQWILTYKTIKAEDERGIKGGPREDYLGDLSVKLSYSLRPFGKETALYLACHNLIDIGNELSEFVFVEGDWHHQRHAAELQIPRSIRFGCTVTL